MKYMGSKNRIAKYILPIMLEEANKRGITTWVEPFVGGANMIDKVPNTFKRIGIDYNEHTINALISIKDFSEELPKNNKEFTEEDYKKLRKENDYKYKSYAGFAFSYSGKWLGGWCRDKENKRDYIQESYRNAAKQSSLLQGVEFIHGSYEDFLYFKNCLIYCDPPYENSTSYKTGSFDHDKFWDWCRKMSKDNLLFVSEYKAPEDFECVWEGEIVSSLTKDTGSKKAIEKLFKISTNLGF